MAPKTDWNPHLASELGKSYWSDLMEFVGGERERYPVYPAEPDVFAALHLTPLASVKAVILGQDPYHGAGQAHGLCFSVRPGIDPPPSLLNIHKELHDDLGCPVPDHGSLEHWSRQGVLLLNTTLTVQESRPRSHQNQGWETFTDRVIGVVNEKPETVVFILWGSYARQKKQLVDLEKHVVIEAPHPSPLSAHRGFLGSRPFSRCNDALQRAGRSPIDWCIPPITA